MNVSDGANQRDDGCPESDQRDGKLEAEAVGSNEERYLQRRPGAGGLCRTVTERRASEVNSSRRLQSKPRSDEIAAERMFINLF